MASIPGTTNAGTHFPRESFVFYSFGNVGPPYIATLSLPGFTIGLLVWLFSTPIISNAPIVSNAHPPHVDPSPSLSIAYSSLSSPLPSERSEVGNQLDKKKKKRKIKKKKNNQGAKLPTTAGHVGRNKLVIVNQVGNIDETHKPTKTTRKPKYPFRICKGDHLLRDCPGLTKVLEVWSMGPHHPVSSTFGHHAGDNPSTSESKVGSKKGRVTIHYLLCRDMYRTHFFLRMDESLRLLEDMTFPQPQPSTTYRKLYPDPPLVSNVVNLIPSSIDPIIPLKSEAKVVDLVTSSVNPTLPLRSEI
jgi:hypothetical protein